MSKQSTLPTTPTTPQVGDVVGGKVVVAVADSGVYIAPYTWADRAYAALKPNYGRAEFVRS